MISDKYAKMNARPSFKPLNRTSNWVPFIFVRGLQYAFMRVLHTDKYFFIALINILNVDTHWTDNQQPALVRSFDN